jgi:dynein heavy chain, axonemal
MKKLFDNLSRLKLSRCQLPSKYNQWEASGMFSDDGEFVPFAKSIFLEGAVEHWFGLVESTMRKTLHELLEKTYQSLRKMHQRRDKWMEMWPGQLCLISTQLKWTTDCTKCLELVKILNEKAPLKKLKKRQNKMLAKLSELTRQELSEQMRLKLNSMITIEIHSRDVIEKLYKRSKFEKFFEELRVT